MAKRTFQSGEQIKVISTQTESLAGRYDLGERGVVNRVTSLGEYEVKMDKDGSTIYLNRWIANQYIASIFD